MSFFFFCLLVTLVPKRFILCYLGMFGGPIYFYLANRLYFVMLFTSRISPLLSLSLVFYSHYLFQKGGLYPGVLTLSWTCFVMGIILFLPVLTH